MPEVTEPGSSGQPQTPRQFTLNTTPPEQQPHLECRLFYDFNKRRNCALWNSFHAQARRAARTGT